MFVATDTLVTGISVQDSNGEYLAYGMVYTVGSQIPVPAGTGYLYAFYGIAIDSATSYIANWTGAAVSSIALGEYSGVGSIYFVPGSASYYNTGTSATASLTLSTYQPNSWVVVGLANNSSDAFTAIAGSTLEESTSGVTACLALVDSGNVATVNTSQIVRATQAASVAFGAFAFELSPYGGGGYNATTNPTGATAYPTDWNAAINNGGLPAMQVSTPVGTGIVANTGVIYGNSPTVPVYVPYGQMWP